MKLELQRAANHSAEVHSTREEGSGLRIDASRLLPRFDEKRNDLDAFLRRFEGIAESQNWSDGECATVLSTCLSGEALSVFGRLSPDDAASYSKVKAALLKRFRLTTERFRDKFRTGKPTDGETTTQYAARLSHYFDRWIELSEIAQEYSTLRELLIKEQFLSSCHSSLSLYLKERRAKTLSEMLDLADQFLEAQGGTNLTKIKNTNSESAGKTDSRDARFSPKAPPKCYLCNKLGHYASNCRNSATNSSPTVCFKCGQRGHRAAVCPNPSKPIPQVSCVRASSGHTLEEDENGFVELKNSKKVPVVNAIVNALPEAEMNRMPLRKGKVGEKTISMLRDTGSSAVIIKRRLVRGKDLTGTKSLVRLEDGSFQCLPEAKVHAQTPYYSGKLTALCMERPIYDLILGNIKGAKFPKGPETEAQFVATVESVFARNFCCTFTHFIGLVATAHHCHDVFICGGYFTCNAAGVGDDDD
ncbi:uncharacterized protein LOC144111984 [Amblyomma americanum]